MAVEDDKRFTLRMDNTLFEKIAAAAKENNRSIGREIEYILKQYVKSQENNNSKE